MSELPDDSLELDLPENADQSTTDADEEVSPLRFGYTVGVREDGTFVFDLHGPDQGVVQLLGLTHFAQAQIERIHNLALNQGDALLNQGLALLYNELQAMKTALNLDQDDES
jgi:hypothetical protein